MSAPLCFIDTETTGVHPDRQVWEVAMIRRQDGEEQRHVHFFVEVDLQDADPFGLRVGRFYERHPIGRELTSIQDPSTPRYRTALRNGVEPGYVSQRDAAVLVAKWTHGAHLVGAVPNFDAETLAPLLRAHGVTPAWHYHLIDVEALAVGYLNGLRMSGILDNPIPRDRPVHESAGEYFKDKKWRAEATANTAPPWKSDGLSRACGVEPPGDDERHTALGDARWAMRLYDAIMGGTS